MRHLAPQVLTSGGRSAERRGRAPRGWWTFWLMLHSAFLLGGMAPAVFAQTTAVQNAFDEVDRDTSAPMQAPAEQPFADDSPGAANDANTDSPTGLPQIRSLLQWGRPSTNAAATPNSETLPPPRIEGRVPLKGPELGDDFEMSRGQNGLIRLVVRDKPLSHVLAALAQAHGLNIVASNDIDALISITLHEVPLEEALNAILAVANYTWVKKGNIILITSLTGATNLPPDVQGRQIQVFDLDFVSATFVQEAVEKFLSPVGKVTVSQSDPADNRKGHELVAVEDLPESLARIAAYIAQVDCPPRQVLIEAHVLQIRLTDEMRCGVDFHALFQIAGSNANFFSVPSLASALPTGPGAGIGLPEELGPPAILATFAGHDLQAVIEALQKTTDSKTLGSPKLLVLNGQEAHIQVGETIYYSQTTTTETSSQQGAASVETGVILRITPRITHDGRVLLRVEPQVSSPTGERPSVTLPPNIARIELQSDVMLRDGEGMIIGGLIDERDVTNQHKFPYLGDVKGIGWLFRQSTTTKERREIIFALVPRIQPYEPVYHAYQQGELVKAGVPLFEGPLCRTHRPWDAVLPDGERVYRPILPWKPLHARRLPGIASTSEYIVPPTPLPQQHFYGDVCDPGMCQPPMSPLHRAFLSDEVTLGPEQGGATYETEIIRRRD